MGAWLRKGCHAHHVPGAVTGGQLVPSHPSSCWRVHEDSAGKRSYERFVVLMTHRVCATVLTATQGSPLLVHCRTRHVNCIKH